MSSIAMNTASRPFAFVLSSLVACAAIAAQGPRIAAKSFAQPPFSCEVGVGLQPLADGVLYGIGPRYRARFTDEGFEFIPAFGRAAPHTTQLRFSIAEVRRGSSGLTVVADATPVPSFAEARVEYDRGACVERYVLGETGVEQSFSFDRLPPGTGDLIVRGRFACELPATTVEGGLDFEMEGVGRFRVGKVVGIAADGARAEGTLRVDGDVLELSLPAAFVADAALPLTLDPLIGGVITVADGITDGHPRVAYDGSTDEYLVVWSEALTTGETEIFGRMFSSSGVPLKFFDTLITGTGTFEPAVANLDNRLFVVTFRWNNDVWALAVKDDPTTNFFFAVSPAALVAGTSAIEHAADIGGEVRGGPHTALCVWESDGTSGTGTIKAREIGVDASFHVTLSPVFTVAGNGHDQPRISRIDGSAHRYAVVTTFAAGTGNHDPYVTIVDDHGQPLSAPVPISTSTRDEIDVAVDGDGTTWVAAWTSLFAANDGDVKARAFSFDPTNGSVVWNSGEAIVAADRNDDEKQPSVCWTGGSCLIGYQDFSTPGSGVYDAYLKSIDLMHCTACEGYFFLGRNSGTNLTPQVACKSPGVRSPEDALIVWESRVTPSSIGKILGQLWTTTDGNVVTMANSCGHGGTCYTSCARVGYGSFAFELRDAVVSAPTVFFMSGFTWPVYSCGSCNLIPYGGVQLVLTTDAHGAASVPVALPNDPILRTLSLYTQWATVNTVNPACPQLRLDMSNALKVTLE